MDLTLDENRAFLEILEDQLAAVDPNSFMPRVISDENGDPVVQSQVHIDLQDHFSSSRYGGAEIPREHGKSVQMAIGRPAYEIGQNRNIRIKIVCSADHVASNRTRAIRLLLETPRYRRVFPEVRRGGKWTDSKFTVKRDAILADSTCEGYGVMSKEIGGRADLIIFDDVVDADAIRSPAARLAVKERVENVWLNLLPPGGRAWWIDTPWHRDDYSANLRNNPSWAWMRRPIGPHFEPVWPEKWGVEQLKDRREHSSAIAFARAFRLEPVSDEDTPIKAEWFKFWQDEVQWAGTEEKPLKGRKVMSIDPAISKKDTADFSVVLEAVWVQPNLYVTNITRGRWNAPELLEVIRRRAKHFDPDEIVVESVAYQRSIGEHLLEEWPYPIRYVVPSGDSIGKDKFKRASWLAIHLENGKILLRGGVGAGQVHRSQLILFDELTYFPADEHDDTLDALYYAARRVMQGHRKIKVGW